MQDDIAPRAGAPSLPRIARRVRIAVGAAILTYALGTEDWISPVWSTVAIVAYGLPLAMQFLPVPLWRAYALWIGLFVVGQSLMSHSIRGDYVALTPNMRRVIEVVPPSMPGFPPGTRVVSTDLRGYRVVPPLDYASRGGLRVFAIGGSTTEDIYLDDRSTWTHQLQRALAVDDPSVHVVNTGVSGLRAVNHVATLQAISGLQPDLVLILLGANDWNKQVKDHFERHRENWRPPVLRNTMLGKLFDTYALSPLRRWLTGRSWSDIRVVIEDPATIYQGRQLELTRRATYVFRPLQVDPAYAANLNRLGSVCKERGLRCLFMTQPHAYHDETSPQLRERLWMTPPFADYSVDLASMAHVAMLYNEHLKAFAAAGGHTVCDVAVAIAPLAEYFLDDIHFTDAGAMALSAKLLPCVRQALANATPVSGNY